MAGVCLGWVRDHTVRMLRWRRTQLRWEKPPVARLGWALTEAMPESGGCNRERWGVAGLACFRTRAAHLKVKLLQAEPLVY